MSPFTKVAQDPLEPKGMAVATESRIRYRRPEVG
jgi:hypothetical protein